MLVVLAVPTPSLLFSAGPNHRTTLQFISIQTVIYTQNSTFILFSHHFKRVGGHGLRTSLLQVMRPGELALVRVIWWSNNFTSNSEYKHTHVSYTYYLVTGCPIFFLLVICAKLCDYVKIQAIKAIKVFYGMFQVFICHTHIYKFSVCCLYLQGLIHLKRTSGQC